jgi:DHA3 family macrolide efflux protein-like MFS transporter
MMAGGALESILGRLIGAGPGAGMALMLTIAGLCGILIGFGGYAVRAVRDVEDIIPDHQATVSPSIV